jgi:predicted nucleic acid-binding protein
VAGGKEMISLDANVILRFLLNDVPAQTAQAKALLSKPRIYVSDVVMSEVAFVLEKAMKFERAYVALLLSSLTALPHLAFTSHFMSDVIALFESKKNLSFVDCYAATEAKVFDSKLYTFDKKLRNQGGSHVLTP